MLKYILYLYIAFIVTSCGNDDDHTTAPESETYLMTKVIRTIAYGSGEESIETYQFTYDEMGRVESTDLDIDYADESIDPFSESREFSYGTNTIDIDIIVDAINHKHTLVDLNNNGMAANEYTEFNSGTEWINNSYTYQGTALQSITRTTSYNSNITVIDYEWENENPSTVIGTFNYFYYDDLVTSVGNPLTFNEFYSLGSDKLIIRNSNLIKKTIPMTDPSQFSEYTYTFENELLATAIQTINTGTVVTYQYFYQQF